jgi:PAS domain S-box-containing protein
MAEQNISRYVLAVAHPRDLPRVESCLQDLGYTLQQVSSPATALAQAALCPPALVLISPHLPEGGDGYELCQQLHPGESLVLFLGSPDQGLDFERLIAAGGADALPSDLPLPILKARLSAYLVRSHTIRTLSQTEARLHRAMEAARVVCWEIDERCQAVSGLGRLVPVEEPAEPWQCTGDEVLAGIHPEDRDRVLAEIAISLQHSDYFEVEHRVAAHPDLWLLVKGRRVCDEMGHPTLLTGVSIDISDRKQAEIALQKSEARLRAIVEQTAVGINEADIETGCFIFANQQFCTLLGYSEAELQQMTYNQVTHPEDLVLNANSMAQLYREETPFIILEKRYITKTGESIWTQVTISLLRDAQGHPYADLAIVVDIDSQKQAEIALQKSEARLRGIFEQTAVGLNEIDPHTGYFLSANQRFCEMVDYSQTELREMTFGQITHPEDLDRTNGDWVRLRRGEVPFITFEKRYLAKSGDLVWAEVTLSLLHDEMGVPISDLAVVVDIGDRKQAELALKKSEAQKQAILAALPDLLMRVDGNGTYLECIDTNPNLANLYPDPRTIVGQTVGNMAPADVAVQKLEYIQRAIATGTLQVYEQTLEVAGRIQHEEVRVMKSGPNEVLLMIRDISQHKAAEQALRQNLIREQAIGRILKQMRQSLDLADIFRVTVQELRTVLACDRVVIYRFNPDWSGAFVAEAVGSGWASFLAVNPVPDDRSAIRDERCVVQGFDAVNENTLTDTYLRDTAGGAYRTGVSYCRVDDVTTAQFEECYLDFLRQHQIQAYVTVPIFWGTQLWGLLAAYQHDRPHQWQPGEITVVVRVGEQLGIAVQQAELVAQLQRQTLELRQAKEAADAAHQAKSNFLARMSHELRTPLNIILGMAQVMMSDTVQSPTQRTPLQAILRSGDHLLALINSVLDLSKIEAGRVTLTLERADLQEVVQVLESMVRPQAHSRSLEFYLDVSPGVPRFLHTDPGKLRQILLNLLGNALKFTPTGQIVLRVSALPEGENLWQLKFEVEDTGLGIPPDQRTRIFEAFEQGQSGHSIEGTGLGLSICRHYVDMLGGSIAVSEASTGGALFTVHIPMQAAEGSPWITPETSPPTQDPAPSPHWGKAPWSSGEKGFSSHTPYPSFVTSERSSIGLSEVLTHQSVDWLRSLHHHALCCDDAAVLALLDDLPPDAALATLKNYAVSLDFETILKLIAPLIEPC